MTTYTCPTCMQSIDRDLLLFIKHTDANIAAEIKKQHERRGQSFHLSSRIRQLIMVTRFSMPQFIPKAFSEAHHQPLSSA